MTQVLNSIYSDIKPYSTTTNLKDYSQDELKEFINTLYKTPVIERTEEQKRIIRRLINYLYKIKRTSPDYKPKRQPYKKNVKLRGAGGEVEHKKGPVINVYINIIEESDDYDDLRFF
jgi:hypothetical protein